MATEDTNNSPGGAPEAGTQPNTQGVDGIVNLDSSLRSANRVSSSVFRNTPIGNITTAIGDSFYGLNHRQQPGAISINKDYYGLTFFTRPRLNLTAENIRAVRLLTPLLTNQKDSLQRIIRCLLDPELAKGANPIGSQFVDPHQAFIPILTNHVLSVSGWPDVVAPTFTSQEGVYHEQFSLVDGLTRNYGTYDITANFRNIPGDPISALFYIWITYASLVYEGLLVPYPDMIIFNEIDYMTRIYRLVLDQTKTRVQKIAACGAAFPMNTPLGAAFNFESDRPINNSYDQISINFRCMGAMYQDDILIKEFNDTVALFNPGMRSDKFTAHQSKDAAGKLFYSWTNPYHKKVPLDALMIFNNRGYPRIDPYTYELQWWVSNEEYNYRLPQYRDYRKTVPQPVQMPT